MSTVIKSVNVSIIIPVYFNENSISVIIERIKEKVIKPLNYTFEIICIDDGSGDNSFNELLIIQKNNPDLVRIIKLTRNFGQLQAAMAGYRIANGDCVVNISADLQDPPELMIEMIEAFFIEKIPIIIATRRNREENFYRTKTSQLFYSLIQKLIFPNMPLGGFDYALLSKAVVNFICESKDSNPFWQGQILWTGFPIKFLAYDRKKREFGESRWTFRKKIKLLIDGILAYSYLPLRIMSVSGIIVFLVGILYASIIVIAYFFNDVPFKGWSPIMILILVFSGIQMLMLGILGEYLWRTLDQVRQRPGYIIEKIIDNKQAELNEGEVSE